MSLCQGTWPGTGGSVRFVEERALRATKMAYDSVADDYARLLPDLRAESELDRAMLARFAELASRAALGPVADLGCRAGRITAHLDGLGVKVFEIDLSPAMVRAPQGREGRPQASLIVARPGSP